MKDQLCTIHCSTVWRFCDEKHSYGPWPYGAKDLEEEVRQEIDNSTDKF